jgi:uncharacterized membrane protein
MLGGDDVLQNATDVSSDGSTVIGIATNFSNINATFRWTLASGLQDFTAIVGADLQGVSADGNALVGTILSATQSAYRWTAITGRVTLPPPPGFTQCQGWKLSGNGATTVGNCGDAAVKWSTVPGSPILVEVLPTPPGTTTAQANNVSADGSFIVGEATTTNVVHPIRWTSKPGQSIVAEDLGTLANSGPSPIARGVSDDGVVVVGDDTANAFRWTRASGIQLLAPPSPIDPNSTTGATETNADGSVTVGYLFPKMGGTTTDALVWDLSGVHRLGDLLLAAGVSSSVLQGWKFAVALGVSADGRVVVGRGTNPAGQSQAWIARLP